MFARNYTAWLQHQRHPVFLIEADGYVRVFEADRIRMNTK